MLNDLLKLWEKFDTNKDNKLDVNEWHAMAKYIKKKYPLTSVNLQKVHDIFVEYDKDHDDALTLNEVAEMFQALGRKVTTLPATAQVASQQGKYIGKMLSKLAKAAPTLKANDICDLDDEAYFHPFSYAHLGSLAYVGNSAVFDYYGWSAAGGIVAMYAWRSVYWGEQSSMRTRFLLMLDWIKRGIFGRDLSRVSVTVMHTTGADWSSSKSQRGRVGCVLNVYRVNSGPRGCMLAYCVRVGRLCCAVNSSRRRMCRVSRSLVYFAGGDSVPRLTSGVLDLRMMGALALSMILPEPDAVGVSLLVVGLGGAASRRSICLLSEILGLPPSTASLSSPHLANAASIASQSSANGTL